MDIGCMAEDTSKPCTLGGKLRADNSSEKKTPEKECYR